MKKVVVVGSVNMDLVIKTDRIPQLGETIVGRDFSTIPGGKGANQATAAARTGCTVEMIGAVGNDIYGKQLLETMKNNNIGTDGVRVVDVSSGIAVITVYEGNNFIITDTGANGKVTYDWIEENRAIIESADIIVFQFEIPMETIVKTAKLAHELGKFVIINPAPAAEFPKELCAYADIMIPNETEAELILGVKLNTIEDAKAAIMKMYDLGVKHPIITLGVQGCVYGEDGVAKHMPAFVVKAVDSTGAGDSFIGGICRGLSEGKTLTESLAYARAVSALSVSRFGATASFPYAEEVDEFITNCKAE